MRTSSSTSTVRRHLGTGLAALGLLVGGLALGAAPASATDPTSPPTPTATATPTATPTPTPVPSPTATPTARPRPSQVVVLEPGDSGAKVRALKARLVQRGLLKVPFSGNYDRATVKAVRAFQRNRGFKATGTLDKRTWKKLRALTRKPTAEALKGRKPVVVPGGAVNKPGPLDPRCLSTPMALCIDKGSRTLSWVVDGQVRMVLDTRFGSSATPTREGVFTVYRKSRDHVSSLFHTAMPFAMFFDGGQAVHYSPDFAAKGYSGASHGCVNTRNYGAVRSLYDQVPLGTRVVVHR